MADGTHLGPGDRIIELHIWNEQFPCFSAGGATLSWGRQINRRVDISLRELARYLVAAPDLADIRAIRADTWFITPHERSSFHSPALSE